MIFMIPGSDIKIWFLWFQGQTWRCDLCEFIIKAINTYLETNSTEQSLEDYMKDICNFMPEPFKDTVCIHLLWINTTFDNIFLSAV